MLLTYQRSPKVCKTECEAYHGLPFAFSTFAEITKQLIEVSFRRSSENNHDLGSITSYYIDAEYNFKYFTWYSRQAKTLTGFELFNSLFQQKTVLDRSLIRYGLAKMVNNIQARITYKLTIGPLQGEYFNCRSLEKF